MYISKNKLGTKKNTLAKILIQNEENAVVPL